MSEWWTYHARDFLLFNTRTYYRLFERYNREVWPLQIVAIVAGIAILILALRGRWPRVIAAILAASWLWIGWAFHWKRYSTIQIAAKYFAIAFFIEALLLIVIGVALNRFAARPNRLGIALFAFALFIQPLIGVLMGRSWASIELFAITPDPTAVATIGIVLGARQRLLAIIPILWCVFSAVTLWTLHHR